MTNRIHSTAIVGAGVELGERNVIGPYSVVLGPCRIGDDNWIGPRATIGTPPSHRDAPHPAAWDGETAGAGVRIGDRNRLREGLFVDQGTSRPTRIGDDCFLLFATGVGHDAVVEDGVTMAAGAILGGHSHVWQGAVIGLNAAVRQHGRIGPGAMIGMGAMVCEEAAAFTTLAGTPAKPLHINALGLRRLGCSDDDITAVADHLSRPSPVPDRLPRKVADLLRAWADRPPQ